MKKQTLLIIIAAIANIFLNHQSVITILQYKKNGITFMKMMKMMQDIKLTSNVFWISYSL
jgi:hypothetical protein